MTLTTTTIQALNFKTERDLVVVNLLSASLVAVITFFPDSPARIILGLPFILFFQGYALICALFPGKEDLDWFERLALSMGLSIAVTPLMGLALNYTPFGVRLYPVTFSLFLFMLLMSAVAMYRRRIVPIGGAFAPLSQVSISGWRERVKSEFIKSYEWNRIIKIIVIICFILITIALVASWNSPATGYEASIYTSTPPILWFSLILSIVCGITIIVHQIYNREYEKHNLWMIGLLLVFLSYTICLSLYIIRGYYMWCMSGDPATHIGTIKQIISDGHIPRALVYPITHTYTTELSQILNMNLISLHKLIPLFFGLLYVVFMYLFAKSILSGKGQVILATVASCTLIQGWYLNLTPNHLSNLLFPMLLFILVKVFTTRKLQWEILLLIMVFLYPPFHPVPTLALMITLIALWLPKRAFALINKDRSQTNNEGMGRFNATLLLILCVWGISWISSFYVWDRTIRNIHTLMAEGGPTHLSKLTEKITYAEGYGYSVIEQIFKVHSGTFIFIILTLICLPILWKEIRTNDKEINNLFSWYGPLSVIALFILMLYFFNVGFGPLRVLVYVVVICAIFTGFILYEIIEKIRYINRDYLSMLALALVIILLVGVSMNGMLKLYPSPYIVSSSWQTTQTEVEGMNWFFHNRDLAIKMSGMSAQHRFADLLLTPEEKREQKIPWRLAEELRVPYHFGYNNYSSLSASYNKEVYLGLTQRDKSIYVDVLPEIAELRWYLNDFEKLEYDRGVDKLYTSGGFDVWYVHALK